MSWQNSPQYLKGIQKIKAMSPEDKAITQTLVNELHGLYADDDMRKQLGAMRQASMGKRMERSLDLSRGRLDLSGELAHGRLDIRKDVHDFERDQSGTAEALGWGNIALSGLSGYADMQNRKKLSKELLSLTKLYK